LRRKIPSHIQKAVLLRSGNRCAICKTELATIEENCVHIIAEIAHIIGYSSEGPRGSCDLPESALNNYENLIVVCSSCHTKIDNAEERYTVEKLKEIKIEHENWVKSRLNSPSIDVSYDHFGDIVEELVKRKITDINSEDYDIPSLKEKIKRNTLSEDVIELLLTGLCSSKKLGQYLNERVQDGYPEYLEACIRQKYLELKVKEKLSVNDIFYALWDYVRNGRTSFEYQRAALGIVTYYFERCVVFEK